MFLCDDVVDRLCLGKGQEPESSRATGGTISHDHTVRHRTILLEIGTQTLVRRLPIEAADKHLSKVIISTDSTVGWRRVTRGVIWKQIYCTCPQLVPDLDDLEIESYSDWKTSSGVL